MIGISSLRFLASRSTGAGGHVFSFEPARRLSFKAGQHCLWQIPGGGIRPFSIASAPGDAHVELGVVSNPASPVKAALSRLQPGDGVRLIGPLGHLAPPAGSTRPVVFLAQGIGITAARSMLRDASVAPRTLVHVGAHHFRDETTALVEHAHYPDTREAFSVDLRTVVHMHPDADYLLTGSRIFVRDAARAAREAGIPAQRIRRDPYYGLPDLTLTGHTPASDEGHA